MCVSSEAFAASSSTSGVVVLCEAFEGEAFATTRTIWSIEFVLCETFATSGVGSIVPCVCIYQGKCLLQVLLEYWVHIM